MKAKRNVGIFVCLSILLNLATFVFVGYKLYNHFVVISQDNNIVNSLYWRDKVDYFELLNKKAKNQVFFVGDSMFDRLNIESFFEGRTVFNRAIGYENTISLLKRLNKSVLTGDPRKVFLYIGTNDLSRDDDDVDGIVERVKEIIELITKHGSKVYFVSVLPRGEEYISSSRCIGNINRDILFFNDQVGNECQKLSCTFIDITQLFAKEDYLNSQFTSDGIHLNAEGVMLLSQVLEPYIY